MMNKNIPRSEDQNKNRLVKATIKVQSLDGDIGRLKRKETESQTNWK